jgi:hypothetical protein
VALEDHYNLKRNFENSVYAACAFNLGPRTVLGDHTDHGNRPLGLCAVTSGGRFDPREGGHLVLSDLGVVIQFPPGSTILLPSAILVHGNTQIQPSETRVSFTQYTPGGLFRTLKYGFRTKDALAKEDPKLWKEIQDSEDARVEEGLAMFSKVSELHNDRINLGN